MSSIDSAQLVLVPGLLPSGVNSSNASSLITLWGNFTQINASLSSGALQL